ncbi:hypothetical protein Tco_0341015 [Tanacetum coccineum]
MGREENVGFDLVRCYLYPSFVEGDTTEGIGLRMTNSLTSNHRGDDFTPLETIRRFLEMAFRNFMYTEDDEDLSFLPKEPSPSFGTGSPIVSINIEPPVVEAKPTDVAISEQMVKNIADLGGSPIRQEKLVIHAGSVAGRIKDRKCRTKELLDHHDHCYARQAAVDNTINRRAHELLKLVDQIKRECEVLKERKKARDKECKDLKAKYEAAISDFDNNPSVNVLCPKIMSLPGKVKEHKASLDRMLLESKKWASYQESLIALESKVTSLEAEKAKLEVTKASLRQEVEPSRVIGQRCVALEEVTGMKEPFDLAKVKGYRPSYKKEHTKAGNDLAISTFSFLSEVVADPSTPIEAFLSKKP